MDSISVLWRPQGDSVCHSPLYPALTKREIVVSELGRILKSV
jgi:hypothetical protein